jgi:hypothetical protein
MTDPSEQNHNAKTLRIMREDEQHIRDLIETYQAQAQL